MALDEKAEEILEALWKDTVEGDSSELSLAGLEPAGAGGSVEALVAAGYVRCEGNGLRLSEAGLPAAERVVRRHRLAERLLVDVLDVRGPLLDESSCRFEHLLHPEVEEKICTLLGHPRTCPHGRPIPAGPCCRERRGSDLRMVASLADLQPGREGVVAYLHAEDPRMMQKLMALGVLPGTRLRLLRRHPAFIFQAGHSQFAVDEPMAAGVYLRLREEDAAPAVPAAGRGPGRRRRGWFGPHDG